MPVSKTFCKYNNFTKKLDFTETVSSTSSINLLGWSPHKHDKVNILLKHYLWGAPNISICIHRDEALSAYLKVETNLSQTGLHSNEIDRSFLIGLKNWHEQNYPWEMLEQLQ